MNKNTEETLESKEGPSEEELEVDPALDFEVMDFITKSSVYKEEEVVDLKAIEAEISDPKKVALGLLEDVFMTNGIQEILLEPYEKASDVNVPISDQKLDEISAILIRNATFYRAAVSELKRAISDGVVYASAKTGVVYPNVEELLLDFDEKEMSESIVSCISNTEGEAEFKLHILAFLDVDGNPYNRSFTVSSNDLERRIVEMSFSPSNYEKILNLIKKEVKDDEQS